MAAEVRRNGSVEYWNSGMIGRTAFEYEKTVDPATDLIVHKFAGPRLEPYRPHDCVRIGLAKSELRQKKRHCNPAQATSPLRAVAGNECSSECRYERMGV